MIAPVVDHLWQSTVVALAAGSLAFALRNHSARVRYAVWFAASVKFLVPFAALVAIGSGLEWRVATAEPASPAVAADWAAVAEQVAQPMAALVPALAAEAIPGAPARVAFAAPAAAVWLAGVGVVLGIWLFRGLRLNRLVRLAAPLSDARFARAGIEARLSSSKIEPGIVGIFRPVLVLPGGILERLSAEQLDAVIVHELCHVRRRDNLTAAIHMAVEAVFWFHPLVWWIGARLTEERERACDEAVLAAGTNPGAYAEGILEVCRLYLQSPLECAAGVGGGVTLKARVQRIAENRAGTRLGSAWRGVLATAAVAVVAAPVALGMFAPPKLAAQSAAAATFDSVSIAEGYVGSASSFVMNDGVLTTRNEALRSLIAFAYDLQQYEVIGPPELESLRYSISARIAAAPLDGPPGADEYRTRMRTLLEQRFGLGFHRERQRLPVLLLRQSANGVGPAMAAAAADSRGLVRLDRQSLTAVRQPLRTLTSWLSSTLRKPVLDETRLRGSFSFELLWDVDLPVASEALTAPTQTALTAALESQLGLSLTEAERSIERLVVDRVAEPSDMLRAATEIALPAAVLDRLVGHYGGLEGDWIVDVRRDGDHLVVQALGEPAMDVYARSETLFFAKTADAEVVFGMDRGRATSMILANGDTEQYAPRLDPAAAEARVAALTRKIEAQTPTAGGAELVRRIVERLGAEPSAPAPPSGPDWTAILRRSLSRDVPGPFSQRGELQSVAFKGVAPTGRDVYDVAFESLAIELMVGFDARGTPRSLDYRAIVPPALQ